MQTKAFLKSYEDVEFSITLTAPVKDWRALLKLLENMNTESGRHHYAWPLGGLVGCVRSMLENLDKTHIDAVIKADQGSQAECVGTVRRSVRCNEVGRTHVAGTGTRYAALGQRLGHRSAASR